MSLFDTVRHISARDAAERASLTLQRRGSKWWTCCPLHGEKTASMAFYEGDRGWTCFGCHKGGDAVTLYAELYHVEALEAARMLASAFGIMVDESRSATPPPKPKPGKWQKERAAEILFNQHWGEECDRMHKAQAALYRLHSEGKADLDNPIFAVALRVRSLAEERLDAMSCWGISDKLALLAEGGAPGG